MRRDRQTIDRTEYEALCHLRDVTHEALRVRLIAAESQRAALVAVNREQVARLVRQDLELASVRAEAAALRAELLAVQTKAPMTSAVAQPLFERGPRGSSGGTTR